MGAIHSGRYRFCRVGDKRMPIEKGPAKDLLTSHTQFSEKLLPSGGYFVDAKVLATKTP
jgi:hypothetical protein